MYQTVTKRTIWVAECDCTPEDPFRVIKEDNPSREIKCTKEGCGKWVEFKEQSWTGKDKFSEPK